MDRAVTVGTRRTRWRGLGTALLLALGAAGVSAPGDIPSSPPRAFEMIASRFSFEPETLEVTEGRFLEDLFYRLSVIPIHIPPLRERREDIPALTDHFIRKHTQRTGKHTEKVEDAVLEAFRGYDWPGNVRELENTIERAVVLSPDPVITRREISLLGVTESTPVGLPSLKLHQNVDWVERETIERALQRSAGIKKDAADLLGISQRALSYYLAKHRIE